MGLDQTHPLSGREIQSGATFQENSFSEQTDTWKLSRLGQGIVSGALEKFSSPEMLLGPFTMPNPDEIKMSEAIDAIADLGTPLPGGNVFEKVKAAAERMSRMTKSMSEYVKAKSEAELEKLDGMGERQATIEKLEADNKGLRITQTKDGYEVSLFSVDKEARTATLYTLKFDPIGNIRESSKYIDNGANQGPQKCNPSEIFQALETIRPKKPQ